MTYSAVAIDNHLLRLLIRTVERNPHTVILNLSIEEGVRRHVPGVSTEHPPSQLSLVRKKRSSICSALSGWLATCVDTFCFFKRPSQTSTTCERMCVRHVAPPPPVPLLKMTPPPLPPPTPTTMSC